MVRSPTARVGMLGCAARLADGPMGSPLMRGLSCLAQPSVALALALAASLTICFADEYRHDGLNRRELWEASTGQVVYTYDRAGNVLSVRRRGGPVDPDLVAWWSFDQCTAEDQSGHGLHGVLVRNVGCVDGRVGKAISTSTGYVEVPDHPLLNVPEFTLSLWAKPAVWPLGPQVIFLNKEGQYKLGLEGNTGTDVGTQQGEVIMALNPEWIWQGSGHVASPGVFVQVALTFDSQWRGRLDVNGVLHAEKQYPGSVWSTDAFLRLGARGYPGGGWENFAGALDEVRIYKRALTAAEIRRLAKQA